MAIISYDSSSKEQVSTHFKASEFKCKCGDTHNTLISDELLMMLERLYVKLNASKGVISSGYRCSTHDKAVGGNGYGQHTKGTAVDIIFYDSSNNPISSKIVSCVAQDLGFGGIANITNSYTYTHLDVRTGNKYYGNEVISYNTVTTDFYKYYDIAKENSVEWNYTFSSEIKTLQEILNRKGSNLSLDGIAGDKTLTECKKYTICQNDKGELTKWVQNRLNGKGYKCTADGIAGTETLFAISSFQKDNGLGIGYLGGNDWYYLIK